MSREQVAAVQRERLLLAMAGELAERGFAATSVSGVIRRAGVSRETFYEQFSSKDDCFAAAHERAVEIVLARIVAAAPGDAPPALPPAEAPADRLRPLLDAYLDALAGEPAFARVFLIEVHAAGAAALARRAALQQRFVDLVVGLLGLEDEEQRFAAEALVAAIGALVTARLAADDLDGLRALREPLLRLAERLVPPTDGPIIG